MLDDLISERRKKLQKLMDAGVNPYPPEARRTHSALETRKKFASLEKSGKKIALAGRVMGMRDQGNIVFLDLLDETGRFQAVIRKNGLSAGAPNQSAEQNFNFWKSVLDIGDFVSVSGKVFKTKKREESVDATELTMLTKSLRPVPSEWFGLEDAEARLRQRYLDLLLSDESRELFRRKAVFWQTFRDYLRRQGFLEVETPVLEAVPGGADAEPFKTHMNALDADFYLRISLELPLKKLLVGGYEKVFELGRIFRNEGIDKEHLQDYTQLEFYWAYSDYNGLMDLVEKMYKTVIEAATGGLTTNYGERKIEWGKKWPRVKYVDEFKKRAGIDPLEAGEEDLARLARELGLEPEKHHGKGRLIDLIFKKAVRPFFIAPAFLIDPPVEVEPLAKRSRNDPQVVERIQVMAAGTELGKGFTELNDPADQRARLEEQTRLRERGDKEAQRLDEEYLTAMEYGMPPATGFGVSERLFAVLMNKPVRETVIFPLMRPKKQ